jgi:hypothetical protein
MLQPVLTPGVPATRVLLVGPRVVQLRGLFERRGHGVVGTPRGLEAIAHLDASDFALVVLELALGDLTAAEFLISARQAHPRTSFLLLDDAGQADAIVRALQSGLDGFVALPLDEERLFFEAERHLARMVAGSRVAAAAGFDENDSTSTGLTTVGGGVATREALATDLQRVMRGPDDAIGALVTGLQGAQSTVHPNGQRDHGAAQRLEAIARALDGVIDGPLDEEAAHSLRARVQLAQINDVERQALQAEVDALRQARRGHLDELEAARRALAAAGDVDADRVIELEGALALANERVFALEAAVASTKESVAAADAARRASALDAAAAREEAAASARALNAAGARAGAAESEAARLREDVAAAERELERERRSRAEADAEARAVHEAELARLRQAAAAVREDLERRQSRLGEEEARLAARERESVAAALEAARAEARVDLEAALERQAEAHEAAIARLTAAHEAAMTEAAAAHESSTARAASAAEEEQQVAVAAALARARTEHERAQARAIAAAVDEVRAELASVEQVRASLVEDVKASVDRATDVELQLEEASIRVDFLNDEVLRLQRDADERVRRAEAEFKKERLRLIEEKQIAASGSQEAALKLQGLVDSNHALRMQLDELTKQGHELASSERLTRASLHDAEEHLRRCREELAAAQARHEDLEQAQAIVQATLGAVQAHARDLEAQLASAEHRALEERSSAAASLFLTVQAAREAQGELELRLRQAESALVAARERHAQELDLRLAAATAAADERLRAERELAHEQLAAERARTDEAVAQRAAALDQLKAATAAAADATEAALAEAHAAHRAAADATAGVEAALRAELSTALRAELSTALRAELSTALAALDEQRALVQQARERADAADSAVADLEGRLDAATSLTSDGAAAAAEVTRLAAELAAAQGARDAAARDLAAVRDELAVMAAARDAAVADAADVRAEATTVHAQAAETVERWRQRMAEFEAEVAPTMESPALVAERDALAREVVELRAAQGAGAASDAEELASLRTRVDELTRALAAHQPASLMTMRSLLEGLVPLNAGLAVAVDYIASFEDGDPAVSAHLRTLRLLAATLGRLLVERERGGGGAQLPP